MMTIGLFLRLQKRGVEQPRFWLWDTQAHVCTFKAASTEKGLSSAPAGTCASALLTAVLLRGGL